MASTSRKPTVYVWKQSPSGGGLYLEASPKLSREVARDTRVLDEFPAPLPAREADLLDIATAVFGTDRIAPRTRSPASSKGAHFLEWRRKLHLRIPVREPAFWQQTQTSNLLGDVLRELTDDEWTFDFLASAKSSKRAVQLRLPAKSQHPVALFSGGLDSLAGVFAHLKATGSIPWLVSIASNSHIARGQKRLAEALRQTGIPVEHLKFRVYNVGTDLRDQGRRQRARSFLYFVIAGLIAGRGGSRNLLVLENGVTSLNLPISHILTSTRATRTTHPLVLIAFEKLLNHVLGRSDFSVDAPHYDSTKAEMVANSRVPRTLVAGTVSCARVRTGSWCGTCTACILRRQVLWASNFKDLDAAEANSYAIDIFAEFDNLKLRSERRWYLLATLDHVHRIATSPNHILAEPSVLRTAVALARRNRTTPQLEQERIVRLHQRYASEWLAVLKKMRLRYPKLPSLTQPNGRRQ